MPSPNYSITEVGLNRFEPTTQGQNREPNLPQKREPEPELDRTLGSVRGFEVQTEVLDQTSATLTLSIFHRIVSPQIMQNHNNDIKCAQC